MSQMRWQRKMETQKQKDNCDIQGVFQQQKTNTIYRFNRVRENYKNPAANARTFQSSKQEILEDQKTFRISRNVIGEVFCLKGLGIVCTKESLIKENTQEKICLLEKAHDYFMDAKELADKNNCAQPSHSKWLASSKASLADALHEQGDHYNANLLMGQAQKILGQLVSQFPDYPEGHIELARISFRKLRWSLSKINFNLEKAHNLFNHPVHRKHVADDAERKIYESIIANLKATVAELQQTVYVQSCLT